MTVASNRRIIAGPWSAAAHRLVLILRAAPFAALVSAGTIATAQAPASDRDRSPGPEKPRLRAIVERLAAPEFAGRSGEGGRKTAEYLVDEFRRLGLEPMFPDRYVQEIPDRETGRIQGRNVGGFVRGSDPALRDEWIVLGVHFDHLGVRDGVLFPGADDNASGVAMMLETARSLLARGARPRRSVLFVGFDLEEVGLFGSRYFVAHPAVPLDRIALFVTADMLGRALAGVCERSVFVFGAEHSPAVRPWIDDASRGRPIDVGLLGADLLVLNRSDYGPFRSRNIPFLFFTTGENPRYHAPTDDAESLDYAKLTAASRMIDQVVETAASAPERPEWSPIPRYSLDEAVVIRGVMKTLLDHQDRLQIGAAQKFLMNNCIRFLDGVVGRGTITPDERAHMIQVARIVLFTVI